MTNSFLLRAAAIAGPHRHSIHHPKTRKKQSVDAHGPGWQGNLVMPERENQFPLTRAASSK